MLTKWDQPHPRIFILHRGSFWLAVAFFSFFYKVVIEKIKDRYRVYSSFRYMYVFFNFGFLLLFYSAQDGIGSPFTYELCIYNKIGMQLIMTKIKILVSKVENYWEAIVIFPRSNARNYLGFGMQFWIQKTWFGVQRSSFKSFFTKICTRGQGISIVKMHYRITILNGYILLLSGS